MNAAALVAEIRSRGAELRIADGKLRVRPRSAVRDLEREILRRADELAAALEPHPPVAVLSGAADDEPLARWPHRIVVDERRPVAGPVRLNAWTVVVDPARAIEADLGSLAIAVRAYSAVCGDLSRQSEAAEHGDRIEELLERLEACGARVRVAGVQ